MTNLRCAVPIFLPYEIIILTGTWLTPDITDAELGLDRFKIFRLDMNPDNSPHSRGGYVLIAINTSLTSSPVMLNHLNVEKVCAILFTILLTHLHF